MKKYKQHVCLFIVFMLGIASSAYAETLNLDLVLANGEIIKKPVDAADSSLVIANSDAKLSIAQIRNIGLLKNLESVNLYNLDSLIDFSFLKNVKNLRKLHIASCTIKDISFLQNLEMLESVYLDIYIPKDKTNSIMAMPVDLGRLINIKYIAFTSYPSIGIPPFINVQNRPFLNVSNNGITSLSPREIEYLRQYGIIDLKFNPIDQDNNIKLKFPEIKVLLKNDTVPEIYSSYYRQ